MANIQDSAIDALLNVVVPGINRAELKVIPDHISMLQGNKIKKQYRRRRKNVKSKTLTRQQVADLGLNNITRKKMNFVSEGMPLNKLWEGYIKEQFNLTEGATIPECYEGGYESFSKMLPKLDFHGAFVTIVKAKCPSYLQLSGIVIMENKNVIRILAFDNSLKMIPKNDVVLEIKVCNVTFTVYGKNIMIRPAERSVKKIKMFPSFQL